MTELSFGQRYDPENGLCELWLTHGALDEIKSMDLTGKNILMFGSGMGNKWLANRCKNLVVIERKPEWLTNDGGYSCIYRPCNDSDGKADYYLEIPSGMYFDVIISDDAYRTEAVEDAIHYFKEVRKKEGILICDNFWQDYIWKSPKAMELLESFEKHIHSQPDHTDFEEEGCEWKTAIIFIK